MLSDLQMTEIFDSEIYVPPITSLSAVERVLQEVNLFRRQRDLDTIMGMLEEAGFHDDKDGYGGGKLQIGIKKLLGLVEMARQEPEDVGARLVRALVNIGM